MVVGIGGDQRQEAVGIDRRNVAGVIRQPIESGAFALAVVVAGEGVTLRRSDRDLGIDEDLGVARFRIAVTMAEAVEGELARIERKRRAASGILAPRIGTRAIGIVTILELRGDVDAAFCTDWQADNS